MTARGYARHRGCALHAVQYALRVGRIVADEAGLIDSEQADRMWALRTDHRKPKGRTRAQSRNGDALGETIQKTRLAREALSVKLQDLEFKERSGALVDVNEVRRVAFNRGRMLRDLLLALPERIGPVIAGLTDPTDCIRVLEEEVNRVLDEMARPVEFDA